MDVILEQLIPVLAIILSTGVLIMGRYGLKKLEEWTDVKISAAQQAQLEAIALQAVHYAEEASLQAIKLKREKPESDLKLERAIAYAYKRAKIQAIPEPERGAMRKLILAKLQESRR